MSFTRQFLRGPVLFRTALPWSDGYHLHRGGMPLYDAVGIKCKMGATTENQGTDIMSLAKGCMMMIVCVLSDLTWLPLLGGGKKSWYIIIIVIIFIVTYIIIIVIIIIVITTLKRLNRELR